MSTLKFLAHLRSLDIHLSVDGGQLRLNAPKGAVTPALQAEIASRKADIIAFLQQADSPSDVSLPSIPRTSREGPMPLSLAQEGLWTLAKLVPESTAYNMPLAFRVAGPLDVNALEQSLSQLMQRHEALRSAFPMRDGRPTQEFTTSALQLPVVSLQDLDTAEQRSEVERRIDEESRRPFDLARGPMVRAKLLRLTDADHVFLLSLHHIAFDGWSYQVFTRELAALYGAVSKGESVSLPEQPIQFADFAVWQRQHWQGGVLREALAYWQKRLCDVPPLLELPTDRPRPPIQTFQGARESWSFPARLSASLHALGRREQATLFMVLLAAFKVLLYRYTGQARIILGTPSANRDQAETANAIGFFANILVLCTDLSGDPTFREILRRVRETALEAYAHQGLPFEMLVEHLKFEHDPSRNPLFNVMFMFEEKAGKQLELPGLNVTDISPETDTAKFDLTLLVSAEAAENAADEHSQELNGILEYNTALFDAATAKQLTGHLQVLLEDIVANPDKPIDALMLLADDEHHRMLVEWNDTQADYPRDLCLPQLIEDRVQQTPDAIALIFEDEQITYAQLNRRANQLAHHLVKRGVGADTLVGICMERSIEMVVGLLGVLKAGGAYVPLDPAYPKERLAFMLQDTAASVLLTQQQLVKDLPQHAAHVICLDTDWDAIAESPTTNPANGSTPSDLAYVIYTSGSTGKPKGVAIPHRALVNFLTSMRHAPGMTEQDRVLAVTTLSFDIAALEIFLPLIVGGKADLASRETARDARRLCERLTRSGASAMQATPVTWQMLLDAGWRGGQNLTMLCGGEALSPQLARRLLETGGTLWNLYGPTETTIWSTAKKVESAEGTIFVGRPIANTQIYLLDHALQPVPVGVPGELYIGGDGLARGYLNRPQLTAERFIRNPLDTTSERRLYRTGDVARYTLTGELEVIGRIDHQVKVRGHRIELGEIEARLCQHTKVREAVVIVREDTPGEKHLIAYLMLYEAEGDTRSQLRSFLKEELPDYMIPSAFVPLDAFPLTPNGKVDRRALPPPGRDVHRQGATLVAPRNDLEQQLMEIWEDVLGRHPIGVTDSFFDLGGHSLLAIRLLDKVQQVFKRDIPLPVLFASPTLEALATALQQADDSGYSASLVPIQTEGSKPPIFFGHSLGGGAFAAEVVRLLGSDQPVYGLRPRGRDGSEEPLTRLEDMAAYYVEEIRTVQPEGPYFLGGYCFGGIVAFETAQHLYREGEQVAFLALIDCVPPTFNYRELTYRNILRSIRNLPRWLIDFFHWPRYQQQAHLQRGLRKIVREATSVLSRSNTAEARLRDEIDDIVNEFQPSETRQKLKAAHAEALINYIPRAYPGRITLFNGRVAPLIASADSTMGWTQYAAGGIDVRTVPGSHVTMVREPNVHAMAEQVKAELDQSQSEVEGSALSELECLE